MGKFLESEKSKQVAFKQTSPTISTAAKDDGMYKEHTYPFCLPRSRAEENLYPPIRTTIREYFERNKIKWHDGQNGKPSNHMCDSQVCCTNFLFPFADKPEALAALLKPVFPDLREMLPIEDGLYVAFEWIGQENYLHEKISRNGQRTRGANYTSADAAIRFRRTDGRAQISLIEWKYTESYSSVNLEVAASGQSRVEIYRWLFDQPDCPIDKLRLPCFEALFYEPFYQFMRQQFLAHEMEKARELGADIVSLLHIAPAHNLDFRTITSPLLRAPGSSATDGWKALVTLPDRFIRVSTESLFGQLDADQFPELKEWQAYIQARYTWMTGNS
ncbi:MAG: hypothetical protein GYA36_20065 [Veillonellaceae bacterium]|nr:hypothetical protein [Veillonellaceae bacterium]